MGKEIRQGVYKADRKTGDRKRHGHGASRQYKSFGDRARRACKDVGRKLDFHEIETEKWKRWVENTPVPEQQVVGQDIAKRMEQTAEAMWFTTHRIYKKCTRGTCYQGLLGCQGANYFLSCPPVPIKESEE